MPVGAGITIHEEGAREGKQQQGGRRARRGVLAGARQCGPRCAARAGGGAGVREGAF